ncbi:hypothetical protein A6A29_34400 [Streptomyces sp. TSRI0281]|nr:hypothetical protein A6A29_34400 [Streptomyces sp. TSRI0281]
MSSSNRRLADRLLQGGELGGMGIQEKGAVPGCVAGGEDAECGVDVGRDVLALRLWFGRVGADAGGEDVGDGGLVAAGVLHDSLPGVDAAQPYVRLVLTEVAHRRRVPVGDLPSLSSARSRAP